VISNDFGLYLSKYSANGHGVVVQQHSVMTFGVVFEVYFWDSFPQGLIVEILPKKDQIAKNVHVSPGREYIHSNLRLPHDMLINPQHLDLFVYLFAHPKKSKSVHTLSHFVYLFGHPKVKAQQFCKEKMSLLSAPFPSWTISFRGDRSWIALQQQLTQVGPSCRWLVLAGPDDLY
jgi:hypothetical protein